MSIAIELDCVRSLLLMTADVGLATAVTDVVVVLRDVEVCDTVDVEPGSENVCRLPIIVMVYRVPVEFKTSLVEEPLPLLLPLQQYESDDVVLQLKTGLQSATAIKESRTCQPARLPSRTRGRKTANKNPQHSS
jgi:hypothetical protein